MKKRKVCFVGEKVWEKTLAKELQVLLRNVGLVNGEEGEKKNTEKRILGFGLVEVPFSVPLGLDVFCSNSLENKN